MFKSEISLSVNGERHTLVIDNRRTLLDVLREDMGLTGTKRSCLTGECGACTVLLDGSPVNACLILAVSAQGADITTIEVLAADELLTSLRQSFLESGAIQCGYCTPGMLMTASALLRANPAPSEEEIRQAIAGNLCRCTGYVKIVEAIQRAGQSGGAK